MSTEEPAPVQRTRRPPPPFRSVQVARVEERTPRLIRITLAGPGLDGFRVDEPAASVRMLLPSAGRHELVIPEWAGNEFLLPDGRRPVIRTLTPRRVSPDGSATDLDVEIVLHDGGMASTWAARAQPGDPAAISGPARGYTIDGEASEFVLAGDETAIPAISQLIEQLPHAAAVQAHLEIADASARLDLPDHPRLETHWYELSGDDSPGDVLVPALEQVELGASTRVWAAGEAAAMQRIRRHLFTDLGIPRQRGTVRGYWKQGRDAGTGDTA